MATFSLEKDTAKVKFILEKRNIPKLTAEVVGVLDISGSTSGLYGEGIMQQAVQRIVPVALNFDDNGNIPVYVFNEGDDFQQVETELDSTNFETYVKKEILDNEDLPKWGGTHYAPVLKEVLSDLGFFGSPAAENVGFLKKLFGPPPPPPTFKESSRSGMPAIIYVITDGTNDDPKETQQLLAAAAQANSQAYFNFIGVGTTNFRFLRKIADEYPNTGFAQIEDLARTANSDDIYQHLIPDELTSWLRKYVK
jgi:hypothetical protein